MSIQHLHALSRTRYQTLVRDLPEFEATEKLDGSFLALKFYTDEAGDLLLHSARPNASFALRDEDAWNHAIWMQAFKSAHMFLAKLFAGVKKANYAHQITFEVLSSSMPNALEYHPFGSYQHTLVCHNIDPRLDQEIVELLRSKATIAISRVEKTVDDDLHVIEAPVVDTWTIAVNEPLDVPMYNWLLDYPQEEVSELAINHVSGLMSQFGTTRMEGVVLQHKREGWSTKIVDAPWFLALTARNYELRKKILGTPRATGDSVMDKHQQAIASGVSHKDAEAASILELLTIYSNYMSSPERQSLPRAVHARNLETISASLEMYGW